MENEKQLDLIDRQSLIDSLPVFEEDRKVSLIGVAADFMTIILSRPSVDGVKIPVLCKECKHYNTNSCADGFGWCEQINQGKMDNGFCDLGERKDNG